MNTSLNKIVKESGINFAGSIFGNILGYLWLMIMTRILSQADFGRFTLAQSLANIALIFVLVGTPRALDRFIPIYRAQGSLGKIRSLVEFVLRLALVNSLWIGAVIYFGADLLAVRLFSDPSAAEVFRIMIWAVPLLGWIMIVTYTFAGYQQLGVHVYLKQFIEPGLKIILALLLGFLGLGIKSWAWFYVMALLITAGVGGIYLWKEILQPLQPVPRRDLNIREILTYSWPISISSILLILVGQIGYVILGIYHPAANISMYRVYLAITAFLSLILSSLARIYKPVISEMISQDQGQQIRGTYQRVARWIFVLTGMGFVGIFLYGNELIAVLFTSGYAIYPQALIILAGGTFLNAAFGPEGMTLEAFGNTKLTLINSVVMVLVNLALGFWLVPDLGIIGAALATAVTLAVGGILGWIEIYLLYQMQPFSGMNVRYIILLGGLGAGFLFLNRELIGTGLLSLGLQMTLFLGTFVGGMILIRGLDDVDLEMLELILTKIRRLWR